MVSQHIYGSFAKWYLAKLKTAPFITNISSGLVLMSTGDVLAQRVESSNRASEAIINNADADDNAILIEYTGDEYEATEQERRTESIKRIFLGSLNLLEQELLGDSYYQDEEDDYLSQSTGSYSVSNLHDNAHNTIQRINNDLLSFWNPYRTSTMAAWTLVYVPFFAGLYKLYDRYLPKRSAVGIVSRVGLSFLCSIPVNAAFYTYGTTIEHTCDWYNHHQQLPQTSKDIIIPYRFDLLWEKTRLKIETELPTTIKTSGACWIPINLLTFSVMPSHLQPLCLMFFSFFWNCYLSMSQHRPVIASAEQSV